MYQRAVSDEAGIAALANDASFAERNGEVLARIWRAIIGLPVKVFVFEEEHRIVAANRGAQQSAKIERRGGHHREQYFAGLAMINSTTSKVAPNRGANHHGRGKCPRRTPARQN